MSGLETGWPAGLTLLPITQPPPQNNGMLWDSFGGFFQAPPPPPAHSNSSGGGANYMKGPLQPEVKILNNNNNSERVCV